MILVTLGTQDKQFTRLLKVIDNGIKKGLIKDKVVVQAGHTKYKSKNMEIIDLIPMDEFDKLINECDLLITHGGIGSITTALKKNKLVVGCARLSKYKEHENDHQLQIVEKFERDGYILKLDEDSDLEKVLASVNTFKPKKFKSDNAKIKKIVKNYIEENEPSKLSFYVPFIIFCFLLFILF